MKLHGNPYQRPQHYDDIHMPRNTAAGLIMGLLSAALGFALIWHIWWLAIVTFVGMIVTFIVRSMDQDVDYYVPAAKSSASRTNAISHWRTRGKGVSTAIHPQSQTFGGRSHGAETHAHDHHDTSTTKVFGFWIYLMSDCLLFATLFATYAVLNHNTDGGPGAKELFELPYVAVETLLLLLSSITVRHGADRLERPQRGRVQLWLGITFLLGPRFVGMEVNEFHHLIAEGNGPDRNAFLSAFFSLVGTHGLHVSSGLLWIAVMMWQISSRGLSPVNRTRLMCLSLFWHFLDIVWICVFTVVYLMGHL
jgi:cytochrome o ubiquinol oxidase subunit 3